MKTIKDIAKIAGVSQSTVSKALNDRHDISQVTKERILRILRVSIMNYAGGMWKLAYQPQKRYGNLSLETCPVPFNWLPPIYL